MRSVAGGEMCEGYVGNITLLGEGGPTKGRNCNNVTDEAMKTAQVGLGTKLDR